MEIGTPWRGSMSARATLFAARFVPLGVATVLVLLVVAGCGQTPPRPAEAGRPGAVLPLARGPLCGPETEPATLPNVNAVVDSVRLTRDVRDLLAGDAARAGYVLLSLEFDEVGVMMDRDVLEHSTPRVVADSVWSLVREIGRDAPEAATQWGVRLRVVVADAVELTVARREFCRPVARDPRMHEVMQTYSRPGVRVNRGVRVQTVHVAALVSDLGTITATTIIRGGLAGGALERELFLFLQQFLFHPATVDGVPRDAWVEIPVHVRMPA